MGNKLGGRARGVIEDGNSESDGQPGDVQGPDGKWRPDDDGRLTGARRASGVRPAIRGASVGQELSAVDPSASSARLREVGEVQNLAVRAAYEATGVFGFPSSLDDKGLTFLEEHWVMGVNGNVKWWKSKIPLERLWGQLHCGVQIFTGASMKRDIKYLLDLNGSIFVNESGHLANEIGNSTGSLLKELILKRFTDKNGVLDSKKHAFLNEVVKDSVPIKVSDGKEI